MSLAGRPQGETQRPPGAERFPRRRVGIPGEPSEEPPRYKLPRSRQALDVGQIYSNHFRLYLLSGKVPEPGRAHYV